MVLKETEVTQQGLYHHEDDPRLTPETKFILGEVKTITQEFRKSISDSIGRLRYADLPQGVGMLDTIVSITVAAVCNSSGFALALVAPSPGILLDIVALAVKGIRETAADQYERQEQDGTKDEFRSHLVKR
jgi:hypothetical protein